MPSIFRHKPFHLVSGRHTISKRGETEPFVLLVSLPSGWSTQMHKKMWVSHDGQTTQWWRLLFFGFRLFFCQWWNFVNKESLMGLGKAHPWFPSEILSLDWKLCQLLARPLLPRHLGNQPLRKRSFERRWEPTYSLWLYFVPRQTRGGDNNSIARSQSMLMLMSLLLLPNV